MQNSESSQKYYAAHLIPEHGDAEQFYHFNRWLFSVSTNARYSIMKLPTRIFAALLILSCPLFAAEIPNVLFIAVDDLRPELGCFGATQVKSPNSDKLASQGMVLTRAYCQVPVCGASRSSRMTGILPTATRFITAATQASQDAPDAITLPQTLKNTGDAIITERYSYTSYQNGKTQMLYDLEKDPDENQNIVDQPEQKETVYENDFPAQTAHARSTAIQKA